jgi:Tol biopolymer transport system component
MRRLIVALVAAVTALAVAPAAHAQSSGPLIAFSEGNGSPGGVYTVQSSGQGLDLLTSGLLPSFSPNGNQVATVSLSGAVFVSNVNGKGGAKRVASQAGIGLHYGPVAWSPNGKQIAYTSDGDVWVVNVNGSSAKRIYSQTAWEDEATHPVFSKSGKNVYFIALDQAASAEVPVYQVMSVPVRGSGKPTAIQPAIPPATPYWALTPFSLSLSPSGNTLAVTLAQRAVPPPGQSAAPYTAFAVGLWPASGDGGVTILPGLSAASWAPNGTQLCANDSAGNLDVITTGGAVVSTPVDASASPTACSWVP